MKITLPAVYSVDRKVGKDHLRQLAERSKRLTGTVASYSKSRLKGHVFQPDDGSPAVLIVPRAKSLPAGHDRILAGVIDPSADSADLSASAWLEHPELLAAGQDVTEIPSRVRASWDGCFRYLEEDRSKDLIGLRSPQIGALHSVHAHWSVSEDPATIVMPTGTGKTDTMISILVSARCERVLVVVPTDALRTQLSEQFLKLGVLKAPGSEITSDEALFPTVHTLRQVPQGPSAVDAIASSAQVIVATSAIAARCGPELRERFAEHCSHLFIDEAHHAEAPTWRTFKASFGSRRVLQFTATPFREDGKPLDGKVIFHYPLRKAQEEEYFKPIRFERVVEFNPQKADAAVAETAVECLRQDLDRGHILMARVESVRRAEEVFGLYAQHADLNPVQLHTGIRSARERERIRQQVIDGTSRIVVCVDMLGEGFDLPELKIAAFHDVRKSLPVTLQLAGRFTRVKKGLGEAVFVANVADVNVQDEIRKLYTRDPDWNLLLPEFSDEAVGEKLALQDLLEGFTGLVDEIPLSSIRPALSTVVYRTRCSDWSPEQFEAGIPNRRACAQVYHSINAREHTLVVVTARPAEVEWAEVDMLTSLQWELYVVIWSPDQNLLFINGSTNKGEFRALARAVAGEDVQLINGEAVFRAFSDVTRLRLQNVGLTEQIGRNIRYTGRMGSDVEPALPDAQRRNTRKSVLAGAGFEGGVRVAVGASRKGRIWTHRRNRVHELSRWCKSVGDKLLDASIDPDLILRGTLRQETVAGRPTTMPIAIDWPEEIYTTIETQWSFEIDGEAYPLSEVAIELVAPDLTGPLRFRVSTEDAGAELELEIWEVDEASDYRFIAERAISTRKGGGDWQDLTEFFDESPPIIWFADGSSLEGNQHVALRSVGPPFERSKVEVWDWAGIPLRKESQGRSRDPETIQARTIRELVDRGQYRVIFDDDGKGEAADVVAIRFVGDETSPSIEVELYHCKFSGGDAPGARIEDLYQVCGQAQKSIHWMTTPEKRTDLFTHLLRREALRVDRGDPTRFEVGDEEALHEIREMSRLRPVSLRIVVVQPGVSKASASAEQLELLSVTETYLMETFQIPFGVIASS